MDRVKAEEWESQLRGKSVGGYQVEKLIDNGKSAAVFLARNDEVRVALKIFDDELIARYGDQAQLARIEQELKLVNVSHSNMVKILAGGVDEATGNHYLVMEYLEGDNLKKCLKDIPDENVPKLVAQLAGAAKFLEDMGLVHRDIKPENILVSNDRESITLLDFGVVRYIGKPGVTDDDGIQPFIGTLQYSSPEFLLRKESDTLEGWRALTFYQIGGVIHDLLTRRSLFEEYATPYARLVNAVQYVSPIMEAVNQPHRLMHVASCCLLKKPELRVAFLKWEDFQIENLMPPAQESAKRRVLDRLALTKAKRADEVKPAQETEAEKNRIADEIYNLLSSSIRSIRRDAFPPVTIHSGKGLPRFIDVGFAASEDHLIPNGLKISIQIDVLDAVDRAIVLRACAIPDAKGTIPSDALYDAFYEGVSDVSAIHSALEDRVYSIFENMQGNI